ncbi:MAG TPA: glycosyltransferase [Candidatus Gastranaerophilales bacterium]|nr:glycosyltransferase [Candidatus Gastranaerophilales bacterium]
MNSLPQITVIIAAYNHEKYVEECLDSVLKQDYPNKEIVIINDGSKDRTSELINDWISKHQDKISVIYKDRENRGITKTANELIELANGEYIAMLASDDRLLPDSLTKRYEYLRDNPSKQAVIGDCEIIDGCGNVVHHYTVPKRERGIYKSDNGLVKKVIAFEIISGPILMVKKSIFDVIGKYDENLRAEDYDTFLRIAAKNLLGYVDSTVGQYREHGNNHISNPRSKISYCIEAEKVILKNMKDFEGYKVQLILAIIKFRTLKYKAYVKLFLIENSKNLRTGRLYEIIYKVICFIFGKKAKECGK